MHKVSIVRKGDFDLVTPMEFQAIMDGNLKHLVRLREHNYKIGDTRHLLEVDSDGTYGREAAVEVTYITSDDTPCALSPEALDAKMCIISIKPVSGHHLGYQALGDMVMRPAVVGGEPETLARIQSIIVLVCSFGTLQMWVAGKR